jgi:farnesyl diphosphate synthase
MSLKEKIKQAAILTEKKLDELLTTPETPEGRVKDAMRYGVFNGGKRLRPFLLINTARMFGVDDEHSSQAAAALEMIHSYSLVHDDLPSMDDDDMRRGKPTCHKKYDEVTAILAGDGLLTKAFEVLADENTHPEANVRIKLVSNMSKAAGGLGMVGGQMLDLMADDLPPLSIEDITRLQAMKTGRLISVACEAGAIMGNATKEEYEALCSYAKDIGLAFQIADDLLDVEGTAEEMGKAVGKDENAGKATFVSLMGVEEARKKAYLLTKQAKEKLSIFGEKAQALSQVADYMINRRN